MLIKVIRCVAFYYIKYEFFVHIFIVHTTKSEIVELISKNIKYMSLFCRFETFFGVFCLKVFNLTIINYLVVNLFCYVFGFSFGHTSLCKEVSIYHNLYEVLIISIASANIEADRYIEQN